MFPQLERNFFISGRNATHKEIPFQDNSDTDTENQILTTYVNPWSVPRLSLHPVLHRTSVQTLYMARLKREFATGLVNPGFKGLTRDESRNQTWPERLSVSWMYFLAECVFLQLQSYGLPNFDGKKDQTREVQLRKAVNPPRGCYQGSA